jgi:hypothetical protein
MSNLHDHHDTIIVVDCIDDAMIAATDTPQRSLALEFFRPRWPWILGKRENLLVDLPLYLLRNAIKVVRGAR